MSRKHFGHARAVRLLTLLQTGHQSLNQLAANAGGSYESVRGFIKLLYEARLVHITGWRYDSYRRPSIALYTLGAGIDAPKPRAKSSVERQLAYQRRKQAREQAAEVRAAKPASPAQAHPLQQVWSA